MSSLLSQTHAVPVSVDESLIVDGQPRYGRLSHLPLSINQADFDYRSPYGQSLPAWRKRLAFKQFQFISLQSDHIMVGVALVDLGWAGHGFFYIHDRISGETFETHVTTPLGLGARLDLTPKKGRSRFDAGGLCVQLDQSSTGRRLKVEVDHKTVLSAWLDERYVQPLALCSPTGANGWTYTQKSTALAVDGWLDWQEQRIVLGDGNAKTGTGKCQPWLAATDDSCGFLRHETAWHWLSVSVCLADGRRLGINLASGVNDSFGSENTIWVDGQPIELPPVLFHQADQGLWQLRSANDAIQLTVKTGWRRHESVNARVVGSHFSQWVAMINGQIKAPSGQVYVLAETMGLLEQHYARW